MEILPGKDSGLSKPVNLEKLKAFYFTVFWSDCPNLSRDRQTRRTPTDPRREVTEGPALLLYRVTLDLEVETEEDAVMFLM